MGRRLAVSLRTAAATLAALAAAMAPATAQGAGSAGPRAREAAGERTAPPSGAAERPPERRLRLAASFGDHMVLQRNAQVAVHGFVPPAPGVLVRARGSWLNAIEATARADERTGRFVLRLDTPGAGGPYALAVTAGSGETRESLTVRDVWLGDVWLCVGDRGLEAPVGTVARQLPGVLREADALEEAARTPHIRLLDVADTVSGVPVGEIAGSWRTVSSDAVRRFSATAWFFGRQLHRDLDVPIGLITAHRGGAPFEAWGWRRPQQDGGVAQEGEAGGLQNGMVAPLAPLALRGLLLQFDESVPAERDSDADGTARARLLLDLRRRFAADLPVGVLEPSSTTTRTAWRAATDRLQGADFVPTADLAGPPPPELAPSRSDRARQTGARAAAWALDAVYGLSRDWRGPEDGR